MVNGIGKYLLIVDNVCDYIPVLSTLSNLIDLFQKFVFLPYRSKEPIINSHYYTHIAEKSIVRCIALLIPVFGNVIIGIYDFANRKYNDRDFMLAAVQQDGKALEYASERLKNDRDFMLAAIQQNSVVLAYGSEWLQNDRDFILAAVLQNGLALRFASERLQNDRDLMLAAVQQNGLVLRYASERLKNDRDVVIAAVQQNSLALRHAGERLKNDKVLAIAAASVLYHSSYSCP